MRRSQGFLIIPFCLFSACQTLSAAPDVLSLRDINLQPQTYRGQPVKVCGFATNKFENVQITESEEIGLPSEVAGLSVEWLDTEPMTVGSKYRCITGVIEPTCGWKSYDEAQLASKDYYCLSTGTIYQWGIRQTNLSKD